MEGPSIDGRARSCSPGIRLRLGLSALVAATIASPGAVATASPGGLTPFPIPTPNSGVAGIAAAPDGSIWFTEKVAGKIGELSAGGTITEIPTPTAASGPEGIAVAPDGTVWFAESQADQIGEISPSGQITEYPDPGAAPGELAIGPDGNPWFTEPEANEIGTLAITNGKASVSQYQVPTANSDPGGIAAGAGQLFFTEAAVQGAQRLGTISTSGQITERLLPTIAGGSGAIIVAPNGTPYWTEPEPSGGGGIEDTNSEWFVPAGLSSPDGIALGPDGRIWFSAAGSGTIGWLSQTAFPPITTYRVATDQPATPPASPDTMVAGADGTLWFIEPGLNEIERAALAAPTIAAPASLSLSPGQATDVTVTASGWPLPSLTETGPLPNGIGFHDNGDGTATISGTPGTNAAGTNYTVAITATNSFPTSASQQVAISVAAAPGATGTTTSTTTPAPTPTAGSGSAARKPAKARVTRVRVHGAVVHLTLACTGTGSAKCAIVVRLAIGRLGIRTTRLSLIAGHERTVKLSAGRLPAGAVGRSQARLRATLTIAQLEAGATRTVSRRTLKLAL